MLLKVETQLLLKITFWISVPSVLFIVSSICTDMFGYAATVSISNNKSTPIQFRERSEHIDNGAKMKSEQEVYENSANGRKGEQEVNEISANGRSFPFRRNLNQFREKLTDKRVRAFNEVESVSRFANRNKTRHIAFLKVHKAGSTTIQNVLFRFGIKHDLNIILPKSNNQLNRKSQEMPIESGQHFDIFTLHTTYSRQFFDSLLPTDYVSIAIVRDPIDRMISAAYYHRDVYHVKYLRMIPRANFVHNLVNFPEKYDRATFSQTRNTMARDFGFSKTLKQTDKTQIKKYLHDLDSKFKLVMIVEKIDESLVLLRRYLEWSVADIIYLKTNDHQHHPVVLNHTEKAKFRETSSFDFDIYNYFTKSFNEKLKKVSDDFWAEVTHFKQLLQSIKDFCLDPKKEVDYVVPKTKWDDAFSVLVSDCTWMTTRELPFIEKLRERHHIRHNLTVAKVFG